jgi:DNA-binding FadR family transcriptional regulator
MSLRGAPACGRQVATRQSKEIKHLQNTRLLRFARNDRCGDFLRDHQNLKSEDCTPLCFHLSRSQDDLNIAEMIEVSEIIETQLFALAAKRAQTEEIKALEC